MKQGLAIVGFAVVIYYLLQVSPKAAGALAAIVGLLLYTQVEKLPNA